jgi:hypothetical protein
MKQLLASFLVIAFLAGCVSAPQHQGNKDLNMSCIRGHNGNFMEKFFSVNTVVEILEIDGEDISANDNNCFTPGKHRLGVRAWNRLRGQQNYVELDFEAGKKYLLKADMTLTLQLIDSTDGKEVLVKKFTLESCNSGVPYEDSNYYFEDDCVKCDSASGCVCRSGRRPGGGLPLDYHWY